jgi:ATP-binding cassette subfamily F protein uup
MLQPADLLLLDEPTNDLDIPTLEVLEESLLEFRGALLLVTHDRYLLDRVSTTVLGLGGDGTSGSFADYSQWETWQAGRKQAAKSAATKSSSNDLAAIAPKRKLSYLDAREYATIEQRIAEAEAVLQVKRTTYEDPSIASDPSALLRANSEMLESQRMVDALYARWAELEDKLRS